MKLGRRIKRVFGHVNEVDFVRFAETKEHIVAIIAAYDAGITHKQVNAVLNTYKLGRWIFIESRLAKTGLKYKFGGNNLGYSGKLTLVSVYRVDKKKAIKLLEQKEAEFLEKKD